MVNKMNILRYMPTPKGFPIYKYLNLLSENSILSLFVADTAWERKTVLALSVVHMNFLCTHLFFVCAVWFYTHPDVSPLDCLHDHSSVIYWFLPHFGPGTGIGIKYSSKY